MRLTLTTTLDVRLMSASDPEQLAYAIAQNRVLFTHDAHFTDPARTGFEHPGILYCHLRRYTVGEVIRRLLVIWENKEPEELRGNLWFL